MCVIFVIFTGILNSLVYLWGVEYLGDNEFTSSLGYVLGAYDIEYFGSKHLRLLGMASILNIVLVTSLFVAFLYIRKLKQKEQYGEALVHFNFLVLGFKASYYYWPFYIWIRQFFVTSFIIRFSLSTSYEIQ